MKENLKSENIKWMLCLVLQPDTFGTDNSTGPTFLYASPHRVCVGYNCKGSEGPTDCITLECTQLSHTVLCQNQYHDTWLWFSLSDIVGCTCWGEGPEMCVPGWASHAHVIWATRATRPHILSGETAFQFTRFDVKNHSSISLSHVVWSNLIQYSV